MVFCGGSVLVKVCCLVFYSDLCDDGSLFCDVDILFHSVECVVQVPCSVESLAKAQLMEMEMVVCRLKKQECLVLTDCKCVSVLW